MQKIKSINIEVNDQENIKRVKERVDRWLKEPRRPNKLQKKLKRQASEQGLEGDQVDNFINNTLKKVERRLNRRKIG